MLWRFALHAWSVLVAAMVVAMGVVVATVAGVLLEPVKSLGMGPAVFIGLGIAVWTAAISMLLRVLSMQCGMQADPVAPPLSGPIGPRVAVGWRPMPTALCVGHSHQVSSRETEDSHPVRKPVLGWRRS